MKPSMKMTAAATASLALGISVAACSSGSGNASQANDTTKGKSVTAKFAILQNSNTPTANSALAFAKAVSADTGGSVQVKVYPNSVLGSADAQLEGTEANTIQFYSTPTLDSVVPSVDAIELPYLFPNANVASKVLNGSALQGPLWSSFPAKGLRVLGVWEVGFSDFLTTGKKVTAPTDLKSLRIRVFNPKLATQEYKLVGADAINLSSNEVVTALSTHTIDGADDPPSTMVGANWYSQAKYLAVTDTSYVSSPIVVSEKFWQSLSSSQQQGIQKAVQSTIASNLAAAGQANTSGVAKMKSAGITVTTPDKSAWQSTFAPVTQKFQQEFPAVVKALQSATKADS
jgi:tripartite ATP-independent transporter DctP family solute receptor